MRIFFGVLPSFSVGLGIKKAQKGSTGWSSLLDRDPWELSKSSQAPDQFSQNLWGCDWISTVCLIFPGDSIVQTGGNHGPLMSFPGEAFKESAETALWASTLASHKHHF